MTDRVHSLSLGVSFPVLWFQNECGSTSRFERFKDASEKGQEAVVAMMEVDPFRYAQSESK